MKTYFIDVLRVSSKGTSECGQSSIQADSRKDLRERVSRNPSLLSDTFEGDGETQDYDLGKPKGYHPVHILSVDKLGNVLGYVQY